MLVRIKMQAVYIMVMMHDNIKNPSQRLKNFINAVKLNAVKENHVNFQCMKDAITDGAKIDKPQKRGSNLTSYRYLFTTA